MLAPLVTLFRTPLPVIIVDDNAPEQQGWLRTIDAPAVLVRPDRYVLGAARSVQELQSLAAAV